MRMISATSCTTSALKKGSTRTYRCGLRGKINWAKQGRWASKRAATTSESGGSGSEADCNAFASAVAATAGTAGRLANHQTQAAEAPTGGV